MEAIASLPVLPTNQLSADGANNHSTSENILANKHLMSIWSTSEGYGIWISQKGKKVTGV